jgi:hypothetical protein
MRLVFEGISVKGVKTWRDASGKRRRQQKTFSQTLNPYNRNSNGSTKTKAEIYKELLAKRDAWLLVLGEGAKDETGN